MYKIMKTLPSCVKILKYKQLVGCKFAIEIDQKNKSINS